MTLNDPTRARLLKPFEESSSKSVFDHAPIGMALDDVDGRCLAANRAFCEMLGYAEQELVGISFLSMVHPDDIQISLDYRRQLVSGEIRSYRLEQRYSHKSRHAIWVALNVALVRDEAGNPLYFISQVQDVTTVNAYTERLRLQAEALRQSEERYKSLLDSVTDYVYTVEIKDGKPGSTIHRETCVAVTGYTVKDYKANPFLWHRMVHEQDRPAVTEQAERLLAGKPVPPLEHRIIHKNGLVRWVRNTPVPRLNEQGILVGYDGLIVDITERKLAEQALRRSEERYRTLFENALEGIAVFSGMRIMLANSAFAHILGYSNPGELNGVALDRLGSASMLARINDRQTRRSETGASAGRRTGDLLRQDGSTVAVEVYHAGIEYDGQPATLVLLNDISEKVRNEQRLAAVREIGQAVTASLDLDQILSRIVRGLQSLLAFDAANLALLDEQGRVTSTAFVTAGEDGLSQAEAAGESRRAVSLQLVSRGRPIGVLDLFGQKNGRYMPADQELLDQLAPQIAIAVENARLFQEMHKTADRLQVLSHRLVEIQETERRHIARELHDEIGQTLTAVKINLQTLQRLSGSAIQPGILADSIAIVERALQQVRSLSLNLRPSLLDDLGLVPALRWYVTRQAERAGFTAQMVTNLPEILLRPDLAIACFRIVQEALTNVIRHAQAQHVLVELCCRPPLSENGEGELQIIIRDDGIGFDVRGAMERAVLGESLGLLGMEERVTLAGGRIEIESVPMHGTEIRVSFRQPGISGR